MANTQPLNPFNNTAPVLLDQSNYRTPVEMAALQAERAGLPKEALDTIRRHCLEMMKDNLIIFMELFQMDFTFRTDYVTFIEHETFDFVIDDDGAVTRSGNVFTIDPTAIQGYEAGEDYFFFRLEDVVAVYDNTGKRELGVITAIDKANNTFTAVSRLDGSWTVTTSNLTVDVNGGDWDKGTCGPTGLLERRKIKTQNLKFQKIKDAIEASGSINQYQYCFDDSEEIMWYDDNQLKLDKRLYKKIAKTLLLEEESGTSSGAYAAGKYGTRGMFKQIQEDGFNQLGYISTIADLEAITDYYDSLGMNDMEFTIHCFDQTQYRKMELIAASLGDTYSIDQKVTLNNSDDNMAAYGFSAIKKDGHVFYFNKIRLTEGNGTFSKNRIKETMPYGVIIPMGTVETTIGGQSEQVPYVFTAYKELDLYKGKIRTWITGGLAAVPTNDCENIKITKSVDVALGLACPEALVIITPV
jgi:hypothetical protein